MEFNIQQFEFMSQEPYLKINNRQFFKIREKKNQQKIFTFLIIDGALENIQMKNHIHCQGIVKGIIKIKGLQNMDFFDSFGLKIKRQGYLMEEFDESLIQVCQNCQIDENMVQCLIQNIITILAKLQEEEIAVPYLTPEQIVRTKDGEFKIMDIDHAISVLGMDSSVQREIKGNHHYMDNETFTASAHGLTSTMQNYFKSVVYSLGLICLEFAYSKFFSHRLTQDEIDFMMNEFSIKCPKLINLLQSMLVDSKNLRPDCIEIKNALKFIDNNMINSEENNYNDQLIQNTLSWTGYTISQPLFLNQDEQHLKQTQEIHNNNDSFVLSENCQTVVQSGIKLPETLRNQIKQWQVQRMNPISQQQEFTLDQQQQNSIQNSSDQIEDQYYNKMSFLQLSDILIRFPLIQQIKLHEIIIDDQYNIDEQQKVYKCTFQKNEKVVKIYQNKPAYQILQLLNNITHIQKLKIFGLCNFEGYSIEECENDPHSGNLYLLTQMLNCDLERAIRVQQIKSIKAKTSIILNIARSLTQYNTYFIHGNLKPSNILLDNQLNIYLTDYGLGEVKGEIDEQLYSSKPSCIYSSPEKTLTNVLSPTSDVWTFGIIIHEILTGQMFSLQQINRFGMKDFDKKGCLLPEKTDLFSTNECNQKIIFLIKKMTQFQSTQRPSSSQVYDELQIIFKCLETQQTPIQNKMMQPNLQKNYSIQSQNTAQQYYPSNQFQIQQSPSFQTIKKTNQTPAGKVHRNTGFQQKVPPPSARQQRQEKTGEFYIQGRTLNLQPQEVQKQKK